jgi:hypothetical protein
MVPKVVIISILSLAVLLPSAVFAADAQPCTVTSWVPSYPPQVAPGESVQLTTTIGVICAQWRTFYSARVDLVDRSSNRLLSTSTFQIGWHPNVTATVSNVAVAPQSAGQWKLQLNLYIFEEAAMVGSFKHAFNVAIAAVNAAPQQNVTTVAEATFPQQVASNETTLTVHSKAPSLGSLSPPTEIAYLAAVLAAGALIGVAVLVATDKHRS